MERQSVQPTHALFMLLSSLFIGLYPSFTLAQGPIQVPPSPNSYGPEGPWNTVRVYLGGERVDLAPGYNDGNQPLYKSICENVNPCPAARAGLYSNHTAQLSNVTSPNAFIFNDTFSLSPSDTPLVEPTLIVAAYNISTSYPDNLNVVPEFGLLDIGGSDPKYLSVPHNLLEAGKIQSASTSFHLGSPTVGIPISVWYGGYDASRIVGEVIYMDVDKDRTTSLFYPKILDIGILTAAGTTPIIQNTTGLLAKNNQTIASAGGLDVEVSSFFPYLVLPVSACEAITDLLPVWYDLDIGLYIWNTGDPTYENLIRSPTYLTFTFAAAPQNPIKIPFALLNLTLDKPFPGAPRQYFPCNPLFSANLNEGNSIFATGRPILGTAFLQGVNFGVNWASGETIESNDSPPLMDWWIAEAPGPSFKDPSPVAIVGYNTKVARMPGMDLETSWSTYWNQTPSGLSQGAKVGTGVGAGLGGALALAIVGFFFWRRRRTKSAKAAPTLSSEYIYEEFGQSLNELEQHDTPAELYDPSNRHELDPENEVVAELE